MVQKHFWSALIAEQHLISMFPSILTFNFTRPPTKQPTQHPSNPAPHPPIRTSLYLASDNVTANSKVAYLSELGLLMFLDQCLAL